MTTHVFQTPQSIWRSNDPAYSDPQFRAWVQGVHDALAAVGMVQTSDTGQLDPATVTCPNAASESAGYEMWRFDDALQATHPLFLRIEYARSGSTASAGAGPMLKVRVGKGSDGAGNIQAPILDRQLGRIAASTSVVATPSLYECLASSGDGSMLTLILWTNAIDHNDYTPYFVLDRSRDSQGAPTGDGITFLYCQGTGTAAPLSSASPGSRLHMFEAVNYSNGQVNRGTPPVCVPGYVNGANLGASGTLAASAIAPVFPWAAYAPGLVPWQSLACLSWVDDPGGVFTARILGADRTYRAVPLTSQYCGFGHAPSNPLTSISLFVGLAILWE